MLASLKSDEMDPSSVATMGHRQSALYLPLSSGEAGDIPTVVSKADKNAAIHIDNN